MYSDEDHMSNADLMKSMWMNGDLGQFDGAGMAGTIDFCLRLNLSPGMKVLEVGCGTGNLAVLMAQKGCDVEAVDIAPNLLEQAQQKAIQNNLKINFTEQDVQMLKFENNSFDLVVSMFGAMYAINPGIAASEMLRVCSPDGCIVMANWTPESCYGQMMKTSDLYHKTYGLYSPFLWGQESEARKRLESNIKDIEFSNRTFPLRFSFKPADVVDFFIENFGPVKSAFMSLEKKGQERFHEQLERIWSENNKATDNTTYVESEYLEVVAYKKY